MLPLVLGTAGHVDHGKTSLVKALTGIDTDRLKEEQERGITIELGFAQLRLPGGAEVALVDVPGHERFVRTMVAGAAGLDAVLLVVAADEGVMPQTREHLEICSLLGVRTGLVALTKVDLLGGDPELATIAELELREALSGTFLATAPIVPVSVRSGVGLDRLRDELSRLLQTLPVRTADGWPRLPIDRVFALRGFGTVVTGTLWSGCIRIGDDLAATPGPLAATERMKVRGLHVHGQPVSEARAGQRVAVNLAVPRESLERGQTLIAPQSLQPCAVCDIELHYLPSARGPLKRRSQLSLHAGTTFRLCSLNLLDSAELAPGGRALAQLRVPAEQPLLLVPGDRFVLRGFSSGEGQGNTVGGGMVLRCGPRRRLARSSESPGAASHALAALSARGAALHSLSPGSKAPPPLAAVAALIQLAVREAGLHGASLLEIRRQVPVGLPLLQQALAQLLSAGELVACQGTPDGERGGDAGTDALYVTPQVMRLLHEMAEGCLRELHTRDPAAAGLPPETLRSQLQHRARALRPVVLAQALRDLLSRKVLVSEGGVVRLYAHRAHRDAAQDPLVPQILMIYQQAGLAPPRQDELPPLLAARGMQPPPKSEAVAKAIEGLYRGGTLLRIKDLYFLRAAVDGLRARLVSYLQQHREIAPPAWKELVGQSRKFAIPLAEYFDAEKVTLRVGDLRRLRSGPRVE
jgi:selenocysteine-specific elongation factor